MVPEAERHRVDRPAFRVADCDTQSATGVRVDGACEVDAQP